jgi:hypothetical protein
MGYLPPGYPAFTEPEVQAMMDSVDFCIEATSGVPIGSSLTVSHAIFEGDGGGPAAGMRIRCAAHEHGGKIAIFESEDN